MKYYDPEEAVITITQVWKVHITARRYTGKIMKQLMEKLQPERKCLWRSSVGKYDGYQADLLSFSIDSALDSASVCPYPDW